MRKYDCKKRQIIGALKCEINIILNIEPVITTINKLKKIKLIKIGKMFGCKTVKLSKDLIHGILFF